MSSYYQDYKPLNSYEESENYYFVRETILPISLILVLVLFIFLAFLNFNKLIIFYVFTKLNPTFQWKIMILLFLLQTLFGVTCTLGTIFYNDLFKSFHERPCKNCNYYFFRYLWTSLYIVLAICGSICMVSTLVRSYHLVKLVNILVLSLILALFWLLFLQYPLSWTIWLLALEVNTLTYCYINSTDFSNSISVQQATTETFQDHDHAGFQDYSPKSYSFDRNSIYEKHHPLPSNNYSERYVVMV